MGLQLSYDRGLTNLKVKPHEYYVFIVTLARQGLAGTW